MAFKIFHFDSDGDGVPNALDEGSSAGIPWERGDHVTVVRRREKKWRLA